MNSYNLLNRIFFIYYISYNYTLLKQHIHIFIIHKLLFINMLIQINLNKDEPFIQIID